jgi:hypothetical protein
MQNRTFVVVIVGIAALVGSYFALQPAMQPSTEATAKEFDLEVKNRKLTIDPPIIRISQGDHITLRIKADESAEFHLPDPYDIEVEVEPGEVTVLRFNATIAGRLDLEWHLPKQAGQEERPEVIIGTIEIAPKP